MLYEKIEKAFEFTEEIVLNTQYTDFKRLREILEELKSRINAAIIRSGNVAAMLRAMSYYSKGHYVKDQMTGYSFYKFLEEILEDYDNKRESIAQSLKETVTAIDAQLTTKEWLAEAKNYLSRLKANLEHLGDDEQQQHVAHDGGEEQDSCRHCRRV